MTDWVASGPDEFGDFYISSKGEQLAKCVVIQNGFRTPEETKAIASEIIAAVNNHEALKAENERLRSELEQAKGQVEHWRKAYEDARNLASLAISSTKCQGD